jgi:hypothetical protein
MENPESAGEYLIAMRIVFQEVPAEISRAHCAPPSVIRRSSMALIVTVVRA